MSTLDSTIIEKTYAILNSDDVVINLVVMEEPVDLVLLQNIISGSGGVYSIKYSVGAEEHKTETNNIVVRDLENANPSLGYKFENNLFYPPKPEGEWVWNDLYHQWFPPLPEGDINDTYSWNNDVERWENTVE